MMSEETDKQPQQIINFAELPSASLIRTRICQEMETERIEMCATGTCKEDIRDLFEMLLNVENLIKKMDDKK